MLEKQQGNHSSQQTNHSQLEKSQHHTQTIIASGQTLPLADQSQPTGGESASHTDHLSLRASIPPSRPITANWRSVSITHKPSQPQSNSLQQKNHSQLEKSQHHTQTIIALGQALILADHSQTTGEESASHTDHHRLMTSITIRRITHSQLEKSQHHTQTIIASGQALILAGHSQPTEEESALHTDHHSRRTSINTSRPIPQQTNHSQLDKSQHHTQTIIASGQALPLADQSQPTGDELALHTDHHSFRASINTRRPITANWRRVSIAHRPSQSWGKHYPQQTNHSQLDKSQHQTQTIIASA